MSSLEKEPKFWNRFLSDRTGVTWIVLACLGLAALLIIFLTRLNVPDIQKITVIGLTVVALWQVIRHHNIDLITLLIAALGVFVLFSLNRAESVPILFLMGLAGLLSGVLTLWQGYGKFENRLLWRHAYLVGLITAELVAFFAYWIVYDEPLAKALLITVVIYVLWGMLELSSRNELSFRGVRGYLVMCLLLAIMVLATMKAVPVISIH